MEDKHISAKKRFSFIQAQLIAPKNQRNNFGKYNYRSCEDILEALKPLLVSNEMSLTISDEIKEIGGRIYVISTSTIEDCLSDWSKSANGYARESESKKGMDESQITGATSSYARKYSLNGLFCIDDTKDADATNKHGKENENNNFYSESDFEKNVGGWIAATLEQDKSFNSMMNFLIKRKVNLSEEQKTKFRDSLKGLKTKSGLDPLREN